jgi:hypothetical protein
MPQAPPASAQFYQQGPKLLGTGIAGTTAYLGWAVAISADGNTAIVSGLDMTPVRDGLDSAVWAAWVFTRGNGVWSQQGQTLRVPKRRGPPVFALSANGNTAIVGGGLANNDGVADVWVFTRTNGLWSDQELVGAQDAEPLDLVVPLPASISADGNTAIVGWYNQHNDTGGAWLFTRSNGAWAKQVQKLVVTNAKGPLGPFFTGVFVALSADGNTAMVGGPADNRRFGAAWVFTRTNGVWAEQAKLVGSGAAGEPTSFVDQGVGVSLSADGNTAMVGGISDNHLAGAAWVFTRSNGVWTQQGQKLVGTGAVGYVGQGKSVSLSADGNTAIVGGMYDNKDTGAAWIFTRANEVWTQLGQKLTGTASAGGSWQGDSVALSADGTTAIVGGPADDQNTGAAWVFTRSNGSGH